MLTLVGSVADISGLISSPLTYINGGPNNDVDQLQLRRRRQHAGHLRDQPYQRQPEQRPGLRRREGGSDNTLLVDDSGDPGSDSGFMTNTMIFGVGMGGLGITYTNSESLVIHLSQGGTTTKSQIGTGVSITNFTVYSVLATTPTLIQGGKGNDIVYVGSPPAGAAPTYANVNFPTLPAGDDGNLNHIQASLTFNGGGGSDYLEANDHADADAPPAGPSWNGTGTGGRPGLRLQLHHQSGSDPQRSEHGCHRAHARHAARAGPLPASPITAWRSWS